MTSRLFLCFLLLWSSAAFADYKPKLDYYYSTDPPEPTAQAVCTKKAKSPWTSGTVTADWPESRPAVCVLSGNPGWNGPFPINISWQASCPYGGALNTAQSKCIGGSGPPEPCSQGSGPNHTYTTAYYNGSGAGSAIVKKIIPDGGLVGTNACAGGCTITATGEGAVGHEQTLPNGMVMTTVTTGTVSTGAQCTSSGENDGSGGAPPPADANTGTGKCPVGSSPSGQDSSGHTSCKSDAPPVAPPKVSQEKPPVTTSNPDGSTTTKTESSVTNSDGSTTTTIKETTVKADGTSTTTVSGSTKKPDGTTGKEDKPDSDLCKLNPNLTICKNSQVMGACEAVTCEGDAIQCATLRAAATLQCRQKEDIDQLKASPLSTLGTAVLAGNDPMKAQIDTVMKGDTVDFSNKATMEETAFLPSSCFGGSKTFTVAGRSVTVNFASACAGIEPLKYVILAIAYIVAVLLVNKAVLQG